LAACAIAGPARAEGEGKAAAEALFQAGKALMEEKRYPEACAKFVESQKLDPGMGTLLNIAHCHELQGKTATAWAEYREVVGLAKSSGQTKRVETAEAHAAELEPKLSRLRILAPDLPPGGVIRRDGTEVGTALLGVATPVDPGEHQVVASAPGYVAWSTTVTVAEGPGEGTVTVPALAAGPRGAPAGQAGPARFGPARTAGFVLVGVGAASVVAGGVLGALTLADAHRASSDAMLCPGKICTPAGRRVIDGAETKALASDVTLGVGLAAAAAGAILVATSRPATAAPVVGPGWRGLALTGRF
jgi:hypothetical protein